MKKSLLYSLMAVLSVGAFTSCNDDEDQFTDTRVTHYAIIELLGEEEVVLQAGEDWTDPGVKATIGDQDVTDRVVVTGHADANEGGINSLTYTVTNDDGFSASAYRTVYVYDKNNFQSAYDAASKYGTRAYSGNPVSIVKVKGNVYHISDALGGFYAFGRYPSYLGADWYWADGYLLGATYPFSLGAFIRLNDDNTVEVLQYDDWYFGTDLPEQLSGSYDPATGTISLEYEFGAPFSVTLTK